jgi:DinB superfamily
MPLTTPDDILDVLRQTPARIAEATTGLGPAQLQARSKVDEWSANEVLAHLRSCADVWGGYIAQILKEDGPTIRAVNPRRWIEQTNYRELVFRSSLRAFTKQRTELLAVLEPLSADAWARTARVTGAGSPLVASVLSYADRLARHERAHVTQIERIAKAVRV